LFRVLIIAPSDKVGRKLQSELAQNGFAGAVIADREQAIEQVIAQSPDLVLLEMDGHEKTWRLLSEIKQPKSIPVVVLVPKEMLNRIGDSPDIDDFIIEPYPLEEILLRMRHLLTKGSQTDAGELIRHGDLVIDSAECEVTVCGRRIELTFREYELLKFLASHRGRVFTRQALLDKVWGYDYFGGDRTVDVHIRRLRSKIEDASHSFIDTIRNIGYRFKESQSFPKS